jgi:hypothetical protein
VLCRRFRIALEVCLPYLGERISTEGWGRTALQVLLRGDLGLALSVTLDLVLDPGKPGLQLFEEGPGSCPVQHEERIRRSRRLWEDISARRVDSEVYVSSELNK